MTIPRRPFACIVSFGVAALIGLPGCGDKNRSSGILEARAHPYIPDVPIPMEFERDEKKSTFRYTEGRRLVNDIYVGEDALELVHSFYLRQMPGAGWEELEKSLRNHIYLIKYRKGEERCEIRVERTPSGMGHKTQVTVSIKSEHMDMPN